MDTASSDPSQHQSPPVVDPLRLPLTLGRIAVGLMAVSHLSVGFALSIAVGPIRPLAGQDPSTLYVLAGSAAVIYLVGIAAYLVLLRRASALWSYPVASAVLVGLALGATLLGVVASMIYYSPIPYAASLVPFYVITVFAWPRRRTWEKARARWGKTAG